ncbi:MAG: SDR family oxidoreductase [Pseudomonadota bacterium]
MSPSSTSGAQRSDHDVSPGLALVTGGAKRIGAAIATRLVAQGWRVAIHYRASKSDADALARALTANATGPGSAFTVGGDLADASAIAPLFEALEHEGPGPCRCLINNASLYEDDTLETLSAETWDAHLNLNLRAPVLLAQAFARALSAAGPIDPDATTSDAGPTHATIINIIDQRVWNLTPAFFSYTTSKAGLWAVTQMLAQALAPHVRVNAIGPGPVLANIHQTAAMFEDEARTTPLGRAVSPEEIAQAVAFILDAPSMTGQMIALDAGQHLPPVT